MYIYPNHSQDDDDLILDFIYWLTRSCPKSLNFGVAPGYLASWVLQDDSTSLSSADDTNSARSLVMIHASRALAARSMSRLISDAGSDLQLIIFAHTRRLSLRRKPFYTLSIYNFSALAALGKTGESRLRARSVAEVVGTLKPPKPNWNILNLDLGVVVDRRGGALAPQPSEHGPKAPNVGKPPTFSTACTCTYPRGISVPVQRGSLVSCEIRLVLSDTCRRGSGQVRVQTSTDESFCASLPALSDRGLERKVASVAGSVSGEPECLCTARSRLWCGVAGVAVPSNYKHPGRTRFGCGQLRWITADVARASAGENPTRRSGCAGHLDRRINMLPNVQPDLDNAEQHFCGWCLRLRRRVERCYIANRWIVGSGEAETRADFTLVSDSNLSPLSRTSSLSRGISDIPLEACDGRLVSWGFRIEHWRTEQAMGYSSNPIISPRTSGSELLVVFQTLGRLLPVKEATLKPPNKSGNSCHVQTFRIPVRFVHGPSLGE
ncbi:hypothetical protein BD309DRAFT_981277 [Dichomitus squalens]|nr:hypothetical protein BD309DRAFT_981277 [Dichomitus squalens]